MRKTGMLLPYYGSEKVFITDLSLHGRYGEVPETLFFARVHPGGSGALPTAAQQAAFINPFSAGHYRWMRLSLLRGYFDVIRRTKLPTDQRALCLWALFRYLFQVRKWHRVVKSLLLGTGVGGGNIEALRKLQDTQASQTDSKTKTGTPHHL
jgi:hypothetical protein